MTISRPTRENSSHVVSLFTSMPSCSTRSRRYASITGCTSCGSAKMCPRLDHLLKRLVTSRSYSPLSLDAVGQVDEADVLDRALGEDAHRAVEQLDHVRHFRPDLHRGLEAALQARADRRPGSGPCTLCCFSNAAIAAR